MACSIDVRHGSQKSRWREVWFGGGGKGGVEALVRKWLRVRESLNQSLNQNLCMQRCWFRVSGVG